MLLVIDTGNTHTVFGCVNDENEVERIMRLPTDKHETEYGYASKIKDLFEICGIERGDVKGAIISSVVPEVTVAIKKAIKLLLNMEPQVLGDDDIKTGLEITLEGKIAPDLEAAAVAAKELYPLPCAVIDMGTATTITVVDRKGRYIGGVIYPGAGISLNALINATSLLPGISIEPPTKAIATDTIDAMKSGLVYGEAGSIDGITDRFEEEMGEKFASIVATGGIGHLIAPVCRHNITVDENLLLKGLISIYKRNV